MLTFSTSAVRALMLAALGLHKPPRHKAKKETVLDVIRRMAVLQIDTISVVNRSPYFVLWSRLGHYRPQWLEELLEEGLLFEYWAHEACFLPIESFPLFRHRMLGAEEMGWHYPSEWARGNGDIIQQTLDFVRENGPVRSVDFQRTDGLKGTWWGWKPEKRALEALFCTGELMIARRHNFQRVYDVRERVHPIWNDATLPPLEQVRRELVLQSVRALGIATAQWIPDYFRMKKKDVLPIIAALADEEKLLRVGVEGWNEEAYIHPDNLPLAQKAIAGRIRPSHTTLLSPFDPLVWDRERAKAVFGFDYKIECYTPAPKRRYGYFTLPILHHNALVGRIDAKAHRGNGVFELKAVHFEPDVVVSDALCAALAKAVRTCAAWHNTPDIVVQHTAPSAVLPRLRKAIQL